MRRLFNSFLAYSGERRFVQGSLPGWDEAGVLLQGQHACGLQGLWKSSWMRKTHRPYEGNASVR